MYIHIALKIVKKASDISPNSSLYKKIMKVEVVKSHRCVVVLCLQRSEIKSGRGRY